MKNTNKRLSESSGREKGLHLDIVSCVLIVSLTTLYGDGAGSLHADGLPASPYMKYLVKLRWSIESTVFVCPH